MQEVTHLEQLGLAGHFRAAQETAANDKVLGRIHRCTVDHVVSSRRTTFNIVDL